MSINISGTLIDGAGIPMRGYHIILKSMMNSQHVLYGVESHTITNQKGEYSIDAQSGKYRVSISPSCGREINVGEIVVYADSLSGTLNDFLLALNEGDLKPDVIKRFEEMVVQAQQSAEAAIGSAQEAGRNAQHAMYSKNDAERFANEAKECAAAAASSQSDAAESAKQSSTSAQASANSASDAETSAESAKQSKEEAIKVLSSSLKIDNNLSEITAEGDEAQQKARKHLGLGSAATQDVQPHIYDRNAGAAMLGMFGFGKTFTYSDRVEFKNESEFLAWVKTAQPGRYNVYSGDDIIPQTLFSGVVEIIWPDTVSHGTSPKSIAKVIIFYGVNGSAYYNRYWTASDGYLVGWESLKTSVSDFISWQTGDAGDAMKSPRVGGITYAAVLTENARDVQVYHGKVFSGGQLIPTSAFMESPSTSGQTSKSVSFIVNPANTHALSGAYVALSGVPTVTYSMYRAVMGLFLRIG